jgi:hypothetical protein
MEASPSVSVPSIVVSAVASVVVLVVGAAVAPPLAVESVATPIVRAPVAVLGRTLPAVAPLSSPAAVLLIAAASAAVATLVIPIGTPVACTLALPLSADTALTGGILAVPTLAAAL